MTRRDKFIRWWNSELNDSQRTRLLRLRHPCSRTFFDLVIWINYAIFLVSGFLTMTLWFWPHYMKWLLGWVLIHTGIWSPWLASHGVQDTATFGAVWLVVCLFSGALFVLFYFIEKKLDGRR